MNATGIFRNVTPSSKIAMVNNQIGNPALKFNQGTTAEYWDYIQVSPGTAQTIQFFSAVNTKTQPYCNLTSNQLSTGEAVSISYLAFSRMAVDKATGVIKSIKPLTQVEAVKLANFNFLLDNSRIIKNNSLTRATSDFNTTGATATNSLFFPDTHLVIPPLVPFIAQLDIPANTDNDNDGKDVIYYGCHILGTGAILNLKSNV